MKKMIRPTRIKITLETINRDLHFLGVNLYTTILHDKNIFIDIDKTKTLAYYLDNDEVFKTRDKTFNTDQRTYLHLFLEPKLIQHIGLIEIKNDEVVNIAIDLSLLNLGYLKYDRKIEFINKIK